ncbi:hypothetical protein RchiOBHm_Chr5g0043111 [Rosa chinensis]|uniref:Uncharacterized protein n=1 Tax=Rosa chinensis TaxID=74649 RepID=A0A2P6QDA8_ROSCH|nr:hypothetical protein RchiOBHm_Chr5g0043111 [Rosa chinensis]
MLSVFLSALRLFLCWVGVGAEQGTMGNKMLTLDEYVTNVTSWKFGTPLVTFVMFL